mgnify:CR=1 FL=1
MTGLVPHYAGLAGDTSSLFDEVQTVDAEGDESDDSPTDERFECFDGGQEAFFEERYEVIIACLYNFVNSMSRTIDGYVILNILSS